jgi:hypothetical protein
VKGIIGGRISGMFDGCCRSGHFFWVDLWVNVWQEEGVGVGYN